VTRGCIERFFKNLVSALGQCILEDGDTLGTVIPALLFVGVLWLIGVAFNDLLLDPHTTTAAALGSLSIGRWHTVEQSCQSSVGENFDITR
jgi:hypothetical protein